MESGRAWRSAIRRNRTPELFVGRPSREELRQLYMVRCRNVWLVRAADFLMRVAMAGCDAYSPHVKAFARVVFTARSCGCVPVTRRRRRAWVSAEATCPQLGTLALTWNPTHVRAEALSVRCGLQRLGWHGRRSSFPWPVGPRPMHLAAIRLAPTFPPAWPDVWPRTSARAAVARSAPGRPSEKTG